ncbi:hypothetical protein PRUPE_2G109800 [Prunus persica]|uniref:Uncharacterized protein n=1 Tax=Prunus persica TaxID=3760 RepID=M5X1Q0_PRUPE|nr:hypothetical protein PRUPE_2G109800 [Prunus persica]
MTHKPTSPPYIKTLKLCYKTKPCEAKDIYVEEADGGQRTTMEQISETKVLALQGVTQGMFELNKATSSL